MGHPEITNRTPLPLELLFLADEAGRPVLVMLAQATFTLNGREVTLSDEQVKPALAGEPNPTPEELRGVCRLEGAPPSWRLEPEVAFIKPSVDLLLLGHAYAPSGRAPESLVTLRVGGRQKSVVIIGDRVFEERVGKVVPSAPRPFERLPLVWERSFGGSASRGGQEVNSFEARNPVGRGFRAKADAFASDVLLPNLEDPRDRLVRWGQVVAPVGFGVVSGGWSPRAALAGTYDEAWSTARAPFLPRDFDRRFFHSAPADQIMELSGDEAIEVVGAGPHRHLAFSLPQLAPLQAQVALRRRSEAVPLVLDTVIIDADSGTMRALFRGHTLLDTGPHEVRQIQVVGPSGGRFSELLEFRAEAA